MWEVLHIFSSLVLTEILKVVILVTFCRGGSEKLRNVSPVYAAKKRLNRNLRTTLLSSCAPYTSLLLPEVRPQTSLVLLHFRVGWEAFSLTAVFPRWTEWNFALEEQGWFVSVFVFSFYAPGFRLYITPTCGLMECKLQMKSFKSYLWKDRSIPITVNSKAHIKYCLTYVGCQPKPERVFVIQTSLL